MSLNATSSKDIVKMSQSHFFRIKRDHLKAEQSLLDLLPSYGQEFV